MKLIGERLSSRRGTRTLFSDLSFAVGGGEALVLIGPNGAGKTTLLRTIAGLAAPAAGRVSLDGGAEDYSLGEQCHYVGHANAVKGSLTVGENVAFWSRFLGGARQRVATALETFGIAGLQEIPAAYLSAGQRRRVGLARLLLADRPVWLLDEPTASLDTAGQAIVARVAGAYLASGGIIVAATHVALGLSRSHELRLGAAV